MKPRYKSKTYWASAILGIFGALYANLPSIQPFIDAKHYGYGLIVIAICMAVLREFTKEKVE